MASTEPYKLGNTTYYRARPVLADGSKGSFRHGADGRRFTTKTAALKFAEEIEADIRRDLWKDPKSGDILLLDWVNRWYPAQDIEDTTRDGYSWHIETHILPAFGQEPLRRLNTLDINAWELGLHRDGVCGETSAASARTLLHTILADAVDAGLIAANPAERRRNRGRKTGRTRRRIEEVWASPLEALLIAERLALLSGRPDDFIRAVTIAYTGMRWGESVGLERQHFHLSKVRIDQQVYERKGSWVKKPPKDNSYRDIHLPPFLADLLSRQLQHSEPGHCSCRGLAGCGGGRYVFLGEDGAHERRSNFGRRRWRPAADGRHGDAKDRPGYPVLADLAGVPWPGVVRRSWPAAVPGEEFEPPRRRGFWRYDEERHHVVSWLPVKPGLKIHGLRHGHKVWMDELGVPAVASEERLGHRLPGIVGQYSHTSPAMVAQTTEGLQRLWEASLVERAKIGGGRSPVPLLDELLAPARKILSEDRPRLVPATVSAISP
ncbi:tyrosine-type recombinase/integrase [Nonomuraea sp. CA-218870]|uniref:tyrosine-type recombinase/integrase n=1 Tax=Nonomuraea sp. CA-218870 TaxID=3239998 RepID=UPI003D8BD669